MDQVGPIGRAVLGDVEPEGRDQVLGVARGQPPFGQHGAQRARDRLVVASAEEALFQPVEVVELLGRRERRMVGDVVGGADEVIEGHHGRPVARRDEVGRHGEILVRVGLARRDVAGCGHASVWSRRPAVERVS